MAPLSASARSRLPDSAFAYVDSQGVRRLPINDAVHVRNALARFDQVGFEDDAARTRARDRVLRAAKRYGIVPLGFFDGQLRRERESGRRVNTRAWPRGTVTFLLTDIEGSTRLLQRLGDAYAGVLRDVRSLIRDAVRSAGGHEVDARADEFFAAFADAASALDAAVEIQRGLAVRSWPRREKVCVRIGIHSGRSTLSESGYVGIAVHTAARICSAGHGGQILASATCLAALGVPRDGMRLRGLGEYELPSLSEPLALFQVEAQGLRRRFPQLRAT
ncbi:MAG TPA: adenylate/guanylate cyclase domain-containing protein [Candidatus Acidoferrales bacterium]|nr:adenylate/guanylate cyclase domain-containing protein [Candidatus Acidoferrales bacterium]